MSERPVLIRGATPADVDDLDALDRRVWDETTTPTGPATGGTFGTKRPLQDTWVAELDGRVVGFVTIGGRTPLQSNSHVAALRVVAVAPEARERGIGAALVRHALAEAAERGCRKVSLTVLGTNARAIRLYEREGFVIEGRLRGEFQLGGVLVDDLIMGRFLD